MLVYFEDVHNRAMCFRCSAKMATIGIPFRIVLDESGKEVLCNKCGDKIETKTIKRIRKG